ncbi:UNVERIFIED_CONTAM: hypothetical protein GTU68_054534, partial [Idotea baltica]|nr:hypothetical protein [Idotea baltica]
LEVACIQTELIWENPKENRAVFEDKINQLAQVDLIILPEMFSTGFTMNPSSVAESMDGLTVQWMVKMAQSTDAAIMGSLVIKEKGHYFNRLVFAEPSGEIKQYDKRHAFTLAGEDKAYTVGQDKLIITYKDWKICPMICYDLRFPVWSRNRNEYDVLIYVANWPKPRILAWDTLLKARAIENMSYCVGVNRIGQDINGYEYIGHSAVYGPLGEELSTSLAKDITTV